MSREPDERPALATLRYAAMLLVALLASLPLYWLLMSSFRPAGDIFRHSGVFDWRTLVPTRLTLENYRGLARGDFPRAVANSLFVALATVLLALVVNSMAGFAFAVFRFPFQRVLFVLVLASFMMPFESIVIPLYTLMRFLRLARHLPGPDPAGGCRRLEHLPVPPVLCRHPPKELYEAARVDGAGWWQIYCGW